MTGHAETPGQRLNPSVPLGRGSSNLPPGTELLGFLGVPLASERACRAMSLLLRRPWRGHECDQSSAASSEQYGDRDNGDDGHGQ